MFTAGILPTPNTPLSSLIVSSKPYNYHIDIKSGPYFSHTDDRYASDVHYMGGCIVASQALWLSSYMFSLNPAPPHPGYLPNWRALWRQRLEAASEPWVHDWFSHQTKDEFWQHGSVSQDPSKLKCPVLLIGELLK